MTNQAEFLTTVMESLNHPFYVIDIETYEIVMANKAALKISSIEKKYCYELTHQQDTPCSGEEHPCPVQLIKQTKTPVRTEHIHYDDNGSQIYVEIYAYPIFNESGDVIQVIEYSLDITDKKKAQMALQKLRNELEEKVIKRTKSLQQEIENRIQLQIGLEKRERHFRKLIENINDIILIVGKTGKIEFISSSAKRMLGYELEEMIGQEMSQFLYLDENRKHNEFLNEFLKFTSKHSSAEHQVLNKSGKYQILDSSIRFMIDDPDIVDAFFVIKEKIMSIKEKYKDKGERLLLKFNMNS
jgi:PAS domain S-box-containing protein